MENIDASTPQEPTSEQISASITGEQVQTPEPQAQAPQFDESKIAELVSRALAEKLSPIQAQLGKFRNVQSGWDKFQAEQNKPQTPQSWQALDPETRKATLEVLRGGFDELYGERFKKIESFNETLQTKEERASALEEVAQIAGDDFKDLNPIMGKIYGQASESAKNGDESAQRFLKEFHSTEAGKWRMVDMAKAMRKQELEAQGKQALEVKATERKKATTSLSNAGQSPKNEGDFEAIKGIKDPEERMKKLEELMARGQ